MAMGEPILGLIKAKPMPLNGRCVSISNLAYAGCGGVVLSLALGAILSMFDKRYRKLPRLADMVMTSRGNLGRLTQQRQTPPC